jgi:hypothetical protein
LGVSHSDAACLERAVVALSSGYVPVGSWSGRQPGYVFKCAEFGLGYYPDDNPLLSAAGTSSSTGTSGATAEAGQAGASLSLAEEQTAWQFAEGCELQLQLRDGGGQKQLGQSEAALLKELPDLERRAAAGVQDLRHGSENSNGSSNGNGNSNGSGKEKGGGFDDDDAVYLQLHSAHLDVLAPTHRGGQKRHFLRHLRIKCIILPRQARDKHRENSQKEWRFA